nr:GNAT family N-acetyltransferase [uncultured Carboxylicivirga sp.]
MRKTNQAIKDKQIIDEIFQNSTICRLAMMDDEYPYIVPMNFGYDNDHLYLHSANEGHKIELLSSNPGVCFEVEESAEIIKNELVCKWSTAYRSIIGYGKVEFIVDNDEKEKALAIIMKHNGSDTVSVFDSRQFNAVSVFKLHIESLTAKKSNNWDVYNEIHLLKIETERLLLEEISLDDLEDIYQLNIIPEVDEFNTLGIPDSVEVTKKQIESIIKARSNKPRGSYTWKIVIRETGEFIGMSGMFLSNDKFKLGEIYYKLHPSHWGKGYATEVARELVKTGFNVFDLHKVEAGVASQNSRSIKVLEKAGMTREGLRRKILPIRGEWIDNYHYAIVNDDPRDY